MSEFWKRTLSGAVFVTCIVGSIVWHPIAFGVLFFIISIWGVAEFQHLMGSSVVSKAGAIVGTGLLDIAALWFILAPEDMRRFWAIYVVLGVAYILIIALALTEELWSMAKNPIANWGNLLISQAMIAFPLCAMIGLYALDKWLLLAIFVLIWVNDSFAYCVGVLTAKKMPGGNHKLFPRVSPKKSWEGLFGGLAFTIGAAFILHRFGWFDAITAKGCGLFIAGLFGFLVSVFGTLGDLMESLMKRTIGVKDSGYFLPGHGGVLDRFDSILFAAPMLAIYSGLCYAVSLLF